MGVRWASVPTPAHRLAVLGLARSAALARPESPRVQLVLAGALEAAGRLDEALTLLDSAASRFPGSEPLHLGYAGALTRAGRIDEALERVRSWIPALWARKLQFKLLVRAGRSEAAAVLAADLARADPADPDLMDYRAETFSGSPEALLKASEEALASCPSATHFLYYKALALARLGRSDDAARLMGLDRFFRMQSLDVPAPFADQEQFSAKLRREIETNSTLHSDPAGHATRNGRRTFTFPLPGDRAGTALVRAVRRAVADYSADLAGDHPFVAQRPAWAILKSWGLIFDAHGHQRLHHHPGPWLTGVYYVSAPAGKVRPGALRIGPVPHWLGCRPPWPVIDVEPVPGTLVLFPSFVPHQTLPTGSDEVRISVAFDVTAAAR